MKKQYTNLGCGAFQKILIWTQKHQCHGKQNRERTTPGKSD